jgi:hypothetical protein
MKTRAVPRYVLVMLRCQSGTRPNPVYLNIAYYIHIATLLSFSVDTSFTTVCAIPNIILTPA